MECENVYENKYQQSSFWVPILRASMFIAGTKGWCADKKLVKQQEGINHRASCERAGHFL